MTDQAQGDPAFKVHTQPQQRPARGGNVAQKAQFMKVVAPKAKLPAHYEAAGEAAGGHKRVPEAERIRRTDAEIAKHSAKAQKQIAAEQETDRRKREADYKPLQDRYLQMQKIMALVMGPDAEGKAQEIQSKIIQETGFHPGNPPRSRKMEAFLDAIKQRDDGLSMVDASQLLDRSGTYVKQYTQASIEGTHANSFMQNLTKAVDLSEGQIKAVIDAGVQYYHQCQHDEVLMAEITTFIDGTKVDIDIIKDLVKNCSKFSTFMRTATTQIAAAEASAAFFGPAAPWVLACIILAEALDAIGSLMRAIGDTMNLISHLTSGKKVVDDKYFEICDGFMVPEEMVEKIKKTFADVHRDLEAISSGLNKVKSSANILGKYWRAHGRA